MACFVFDTTYSGLLLLSLVSDARGRQEVNFVVGTKYLSSISAKLELERSMIIEVQQNEVRISSRQLIFNEYIYIYEERKKLSGQKR